MLESKENNDAVIFHIGRCGSTLLSNILGQHPIVECRGEIFNPLMKIKLRGEPIPSIDNVLLNLRKKKNSPIQIFELKFLNDQHLSLYKLEINQFIEIVVNNGFNRFIVLERKNYLRRMISHCISQQTSIYHLKANQTAVLVRIKIDLQNIKVGIATRSLIEWMDIFSKSYENIRLMLSYYSFCVLSYVNELLNDITLGYNKVCKYLNIIPDKISITTKRTNPFSLKEILINYNEVERHLHNTIYEWMLY